MQQPAPTNRIESSLQALLADPAVAKMLADLAADAARTVAEQRRIAEIPAPPFHEGVRAQYYRQRFIELGLDQAAIDAEGNVIALRRGSGGGPKLVVSAHLDSVFPEGTDVTVKEADGTLRGPGIGDNARGLAVLLSVLRAIDAHAVKTVGDVMWVGTVGEEELGNLRGVKALFRDHHDIDGFISIDGLKIARVVNQATGSRRYEVIFRGPGGHSFSAFGTPSAVHAMGRAIARIAELTTPSEPKTTFTVGTVQGGTSVNAIAAEARMRVDLRSTSPDELARLEASVLAIVQEAVADENKRWSSDAIAAETRLIGDRPAGMTPEDSPVIATVRRTLGALMPEQRIVLESSSTDSNIAMSLGIPAVTIAGGGEGGGQHSLTEWYRPAEAHLGPQNALLTLLMLVGLDGVSAPVLARK
jgi:acetylornithine deacetylase/succinyl-diaminopimelate desuccinylase-like protein